MLNENCSNPSGHGYFFFNRFCWSAIVAGALVGLGLSTLLHLFGAAIGLSLVKTTQNGMMTMAIGGFIAFLISTIVSTFVAGATAGYLSRKHCEPNNLGVLYGFVTWCLGMILMVLLATHMGHYLSHYSNFLMHRTYVGIQNNDMPMANTFGRNAITVVDLSAQKATQVLGGLSFMIFVLFFVGAISSCFGGHWGRACLCCKHDSTCGHQE